MKSGIAGAGLALILAFGSVPALAAETEAPCTPVEKKKVKIEGWYNKEFKSKRRDIKKEFNSIQNVRTALKAFPLGKTAKVVGIGRCVPAYIARHVIEHALKYTDGVESLVHQAFLPTHWIGIGTTQFDEPSQQIITAEQVKQLLNPELGDDAFHEMYREFSIQNDTVKYFGQTTNNAKKVD